MSTIVDFWSNITDEDINKYLKIKNVYYCRYNTWAVGDGTENGYLKIKNVYYCRFIWFLGCVGHREYLKIKNVYYCRSFSIQRKRESLGVFKN